MTNDEQLRFECLRLAHSDSNDKAEIIKLARAYADFVSGRNDAEIIGAVHELARRVAA